MFEELIERGLVKEKAYPNGLSVFKYTRKVFYDNLWDADPELLEARGMVIETATGDKVIWPFTKVFNYHERGTDCDPDADIYAVEKVNGFMGSARMWKGTLVVSTTGTLDSEYADMARDYIEALDYGNMLDEFTYIFEICSPEDPHIIHQEEGAYLIGMRDMETGELVDEQRLDYEADMLGAYRPNWFYTTFKELVATMPDWRIEGYMVRELVTSETLMKIKGPHYLIKKFLMRLGQKKQEMMFNDKEQFLHFIDEEFYAIVHYITRWFDLEKWNNMTEQERRAVIEGYFNDIH